jgi:hypothetical protein
MRHPSTHHIAVTTDIITPNSLVLFRSSGRTTATITTIGPGFTYLGLTGRSRLGTITIGTIGITTSEHTASGCAWLI